MSLTDDRDKEEVVDDDEEVEVKLVDFTVMAIGFAAIVVNFIIFANMGDSGLGSEVARIIRSII